VERVVKFARYSLSNAGMYGLSTAVLHSGWKSPPHPQNTSAVVGNLKYRSGSFGSWIPTGDRWYFPFPSFWIRLKYHRSIRSDRSKKRPQNQTGPIKTVVPGPKKNQIDAKYSVRCRPLPQANSYAGLQVWPLRVC